MKEIFDQIADVRGEALAGRLLAEIALDCILRNTAFKAEALDYFAMQIDRDLNAANFVGGDAVQNEKVREIARLRAHQAIDGLRAAHKL